MFNKDFYPTPTHVIEQMGIDCAGKTVLEPSAGKGNIVEWLKANGAREVLACEKNADLAEIVKSKARFIKHDFLEVRPEEVSHIELIVMNPPFSADEKHLLHAWEIAPGGCEIISLVNYETIDNSYSNRRRELKRIIDDFGSAISLEDVFTDAERKTSVEIGLVRLHKPGSGENEFDGFFMEEEEELPNGNGIMKFNSIRDVVQRYVYAVRLFDEHEALNARMGQLTTPFGIGGFSIEIGYDNRVADRESFKKELQKKAWRYLFKEMNIEKYVTSGVMKDINRFVESQTKVPFTMKNIFRMFEIIVGTREETFNRALVEAVDKFTEHTHENRYNVEGWKTNAGHMLNRKFIVNYMFEFGWSRYLSPRHSGNQDKMQDLAKVLCALTGENYDDLPSLYKVCSDAKPQPNDWFDWGFFQVKGFKKGTMHAKFKDEKVWEMLNRRYAKIKGQVLPEKFRI